VLTRENEKELSTDTMHSYFCCIIRH